MNAALESVPQVLLEDGQARAVVSPLDVVMLEPAVQEIELRSVESNERHSNGDENRNNRAARVVLAWVSSSVVKPSVAGCETCTLNEDDSCTNWGGQVDD